MSDWHRGGDLFNAGMTEVDEPARAPVFREAVLLLRGADATAETTAQADDIQWLLDSEAPRRPTHTWRRPPHQREILPPKLNAVIGGEPALAFVLVVAA